MYGFEFSGTPVEWTTKGVRYWLNVGNVHSTMERMRSIRARCASTPATPTDLKEYEEHRRVLRQMPNAMVRPLTVAQYQEMRSSSPLLNVDLGAKDQTLTIKNDFNAMESNWREHIVKVQTDSLENFFYRHPDGELAGTREAVVTIERFYELSSRSSDSRPERITLELYNVIKEKGLLEPGLGEDLLTQLNSSSQAAEQESGDVQNASPDTSTT